MRLTRRTFSYALTKHTHTNHKLGRRAIFFQWGHVRAVLLNEYCKLEYKGSLIVRIDIDTKHLPFLYTYVCTSRYSEKWFIIFYESDNFPRLGLLNENKFYKYVRQRWLAENIFEACDLAKRIGFDKTTAQKLVELATDILLNGNIKTIVEGMNDIVPE